MVLVHENKDILTHNTARFLVLCNFLQKSFTLRASISLPKVNGVVAQSRPAVITSLPQRPLDNSNNNVTENHSMSILLGSMPGIYRARTASNGALSQQQGNTSNSATNDNNTNTNNNSNSNNNKAYSYSLPSALDEQQLMQQVNQDVNRSSPALNHIVDELETNTIEKFIDKKSTRSSGQQQQSVTTAKSSIATGNNSQTVEQRQSKQLGAAYNFAAASNNNSNSLLPTTSRRGSTMNDNVVEKPREKARSLTLSSLDGNINKLPQPVQVQSKLLFVERSNLAPRVGRQQQQQHYSKPKTTLQTNLVERSTSSSQFDTLELATSVSEISAPTSGQRVTTTIPATAQPSPVTGERDDALFSASRNLKQWPKNKRQRGEVGADLQLPQQQSPSIIMTNNHRIPGDYLPLAKAVADSSNLAKGSQSSANTDDNNNNNFSIKYSAAKVDEFPVGQGDVDVPLLNPDENNNNTSKGRGGRMRSVEDEFRSLNASNSNSQQSKSQQARTGSSWTVDNRMGEMMGATEVTARNSNSSSNNSNNLPAEPQQVDLTGETTNNNNEFSSDLQPPSAGLPAVNGTLAQNITSLLLKWSLKTLTNFARKSFGTLANQNGQNEMASSLNNNSDFVPDSEHHQHDYEQRNDPTQIDRLTINHSKDNQQNTSTPVLGNFLKNPTTNQKVSTSSNKDSSDRTLVTVASTTATPMETTSTGQVAVSESKKEILMATSTMKPALMINNPEVSDEMLDDFMASTSRVGEVPKISTVPPQVVAESSDNPRSQPKQHNHSRPSNYSKSLDLARIAGGESVTLASNRLRTSEKNNIGKANATKHRNQNHHLHHQQQQQQHQQQLIEERQDRPIQSNQESAWTNRDPFYSSWMFYGLLLFIAVITGTFLTFWLVTVPMCENKVKSSGRNVNHRHNEIHHHQNPQAFLQSQQQQHAAFNNNTVAPQTTLKLNHPTSVACIDNNLNSPRSRSLLDISYEKYDYKKFENYQNDVTTNKNNNDNHSSFSVHVNKNSSSITNNGNNGKISNNNNNNIGDINHHQSRTNRVVNDMNNRGDRLTAGELINNRLDQQSPSSTSQRTRSTSAGSTIMVDENDCKNNEFLYTEHVLINPGLSFGGESYA